MPADGDEIIGPARKQGKQNQPYHQHEMPVDGAQLGTQPHLCERGALPYPGRCAAEDEKPAKNMQAVHSGNQVEKTVRRIVSDDIAGSDKLLPCEQLPDEKPGGSRKSGRKGKLQGVAPIMVVFGAICHWYPKVTGRMLDETLGRVHFFVTFVGAYAIFFPMHYLGLLGVPRRYSELGDTAFIPPSVQALNEFITIMALIVGAAQILFLFNLAWSLRRGKEAGGNPWRATTLEWQTPQTPPAHGNWGKELPVVYRWAYDYSVPGAAQDFIPQNQPNGDRISREPAS